jgi:PH domain
MSSSRSIDSCGDMAAASISTSDTPCTPMSNSKQNTSPDFDSVSSTGITPVNPFESNITDIPPIPSLNNSGSGLDSSHVHIVSIPNNNPRTSGVDECLPLQSANSLERPISPDRSHSSVTITPLHPRSPSSTNTRNRMALSDMSASSIPILPTTTLPSIPSSSQIPQQSTTPAGCAVIPHQLLFEIGDSLVPSSSPQTGQSSATVPSQIVNSPTESQSRRLFDDDENTEPSSAANTSVHHNSARQVETPSHLKATVDNLSGSIKKMIEDTRRRLTVKENRKDSDGEDIHSSALISGYLQKYGRNGKWQTRWFETDGESLSYFKDRKRTKLLATLDLEKVRAHHSLFS